MSHSPEFLFDFYCHAAFGCNFGGLSLEIRASFSASLLVSQPWLNLPEAIFCFVKSAHNGCFNDVNHASSAFPANVEFHDCRTAFPEIQPDNLALWALIFAIRVIFVVIELVQRLFYRSLFTSRLTLISPRFTTPLSD